MAKARVQPLKALAIGCVLVFLQLRQSLFFLRSSSASVSLSDQTFVVPSSTTSKQKRSFSDVKEPHIETTKGLVIDILSIGSAKRSALATAQLETMGNHPSVRHFVSATEADDDDAACHDLDRSDAKAIANFCYIPRHQEKNVDIIPLTGQPRSIIQQRRRGYASWDTFLTLKAHPTGWLCAQKRPNDAWQKLMLVAEYSSDENLPDYVFFVDDDTFIDMDAVTDYLQAVYTSPEEAVVMAGCLIRFNPRKYNMTAPVSFKSDYFEVTPLVRRLGNNDIERSSAKPFATHSLPKHYHSRFRVCTKRVCQIKTEPISRTSILPGGHELGATDRFVRFDQ